MYKVLIVEDDYVIAKAMADNLSNWGCVPKISENWNDIMKDFAEFDPALVLLDVSLPCYNGFHWCNKIRSVSKVPIIFISSMSDNMNIVMAMNLGADDFITKPFDLTVLTAKVQAILRRTYDFSITQSILKCKGAILNPASGFRVIIVTVANSLGNIRVFELLPKLKTEKLSGWCTA